MNKDISLIMKKIKAILFDVDGVLTDGRIILGPEQLELKCFYARDGHRIKLAKRADISIFFITGRQSRSVSNRAAELGIDGVFQAILDKASILDDICSISSTSVEEMAFMGDDLVDLPIMNAVGLSSCPNDAAPEVLQRADLVIDLPGGQGAAGLFVETILKAQGKWEPAIRNYLV